MHADVGNFREPPIGHLIEVLQRAELAAAEQVRFDVMERPLHFAFGLWPATPTGHRPETVVRGEGQEAGVVDRFVVFVAGHHDLHVVVETCGCHAAQVFEGPHVLSDRGLHVGGGREAQVLPPRIAQHVTEQVHFAATFLSEVQRVDGVVHLSLDPGTGLKTLHRRPAKLGSQLFHPLAKNRIAPDNPGGGFLPRAGLR